MASLQPSIEEPAAVPVLRYLISIAVALILTVVGGFLAFSGGFSILTMLTFQFVLDQEIGASGTSLNDVFAETHSGRLDFFADPSAWLMTVGLFLGGLVLVFLGLRGLYRRLLAGIPEEGEGDAETPLGQLGSILVFALGAAYGSYAMVMLLISAADYLALRTGGVRAMAVIEKEWTARDTESKDDRGQFVSYRFQTERGEIVVAEKSVPHSILRDYEAGSTIEIVYAREDPSRTLIPVVESWTAFLTRVAAYGFLIVFGIRGLRRNLRLQDLDEEYA